MRSTMFVRSFEEGQRQLTCEQYEDAMRSLAYAHQLALELDDSMGAYLSCDYLLLSINLACPASREEEEERCNSMLVGFLQGHNNAEATAWAAYYVGRSLFLRGEDMDDRAAHWLQICCDHASTDNLKYEVRMSLGIMFTQRSTSKAVDHFNSALEAAGKIVILQVFTLYMLCTYLCKHNTEGALRQLSHLKSLADLSDDPFIKGVSARVEGYLCFWLHQYDQSKKANEDAISLLKHLPVSLEKHYETYSPLLGDPSYSIQRMQMTVESLASAYNEIGTIELYGKNLQLATSAFSNVLQYNGTPDVKVDALSGLASICFWQKQLKEADAYIDAILELSKDSYQSAYALVLRARVTWRCHEDNFSEDVFTKAYGFLLEAEKIIAKKWPGDLAIIQHWQGFLCAKMLNKDQAIKKFEQSLNGFWEKEAMLGPSSSEGRISHLEFQKSIFRCIQICLVSSKPAQVKRAIIWAERERARDLIREMNSYTLDVDAGPVSFDSKDEDMIWEEIESIVSLAGEDSVFLLFTQLQDNIAIMYLLHAGDEPQCKLSVIEEDDNQVLMPAIFTRVLQAHPSPRSSCKEQQKLLEDFHLLLIKPWKDDLKRINPRKIIIVPTEELSLLPFAALRDGSWEDEDEDEDDEDEDEDDEGPYLIQQYALAYAPSLQVFKQCQLQWESLKNRRPSHEQRALVVGNPTLEDHPEFQDLKHAKQEAVYVAQKLREDACFCRVELLQENDATVEAVLDSLTSSNWVHMACHATVEEKYPNGALLLSSHSSTSGAMQHGFTSVAGYSRSRKSLDDATTLNSAMMVAPESATLFRGMANRNLHHGNMIEQLYVDKELLKFGQQTEGRAGMLTGDDMSKRLQASGVVLSACSTGKGQVCGEGILGLSRSLHVAGVPATLVSLWIVNDKTTLHFMELLYSKLSEGLELALAVQSVMKSMIKTEDIDGNPKYDVEHWAPFVMSGSPFVKLVYESE